MKKRKGFTLVEVLIASAFTIVLMMFCMTLFVMGSNMADKANNELEVQSDTRIAAEYFMQSIREPTTIHVVAWETFTIEHAYDPAYDYIGVERLFEDDGSVRGDRLIRLTANNPGAMGIAPKTSPYDNHDVDELIGLKKGYTFRFSMAKEGDEEDHLFRFTIDVFLNNPDMTGEPYYSISTQVDARNAMDIREFTGGGNSIGAIGFTNVSGDVTRTSGSMVMKPVNVALVLDISGSMAGTPLVNLKDAAIAFCDQLLPAGNVADGSVSISIIPFHTQVDSVIDGTALRTLNNTNYNKPGVTTYTLTNTKVTSSMSIYNAISTLKTTGMTNQVDGLRRAYWSIEAKVGTGAAAKDELNYIVLFTDGAPNYITPFMSGSWSAAYSSTYINTNTKGVLYGDSVDGVSGTNAGAQKYGDYMNFWVQKAKSDFGNCELYYVVLGSGTTSTTASTLARRMYLTTNGTNGITAPLDGAKYQTTADPTKLQVIFEEIAGSITMDTYAHLEGPRDSR